MFETYKSGDRVERRGLLNADRLAYRQLEARFRGIDSQAASHREHLLAQFSAPINVLPVSTFVGVQDLMNTAAEIFNGLVRAWDETRISGPRQYHDQIRRERGAQAVTVCRQTYVELLSLIEFSITHSIRNIPELFPPPRGKAKIYLAQVFAASADLGWIPCTHKEAWAGLTELRNAVVHRNGISDKTISYAVTGDWGLQFQQDARITDKIDLFPHLCEWAVEAMHMWSLAYLNAAAPKGWETFYVP